MRFLTSQLHFLISLPCLLSVLLHTADSVSSAHELLVGRYVPGVKSEVLREQVLQMALAFADVERSSSIRVRCSETSRIDVKALVSVLQVLHNSVPSSVLYSIALPSLVLLAFVAFHFALETVHDGLSAGAASQPYQYVRRSLVLVHCCLVEPLVQLFLHSLLLAILASASQLASYRPGTPGFCTNRKAQF